MIGCRPGLPCDGRTVGDAFPGAEFADTWYPSALADQLAGSELNPGAADIRARFSSNFAFYFGFDNNEGALVDMLPVVLHELGHGLGFANFVDESNGTNLLGRTDVYSHYTLDVGTARLWSAMTDLERRTSALNLRKVSWSGRQVGLDVPAVLLPGEPYVGTPLGALMLGTASFGPSLTGAGVSGDLVYANDGRRGSAASMRRSRSRRAASRSPTATRSSSRSAAPRRCG